MSQLSTILADFMGPGRSAAQIVALSADEFTLRCNGEHMLHLRQLPRTDIIAMYACAGVLQPKDGPMNPDSGGDGDWKVIHRCEWPDDCLCDDFDPMELCLQDESDAVVLAARASAAALDTVHFEAWMRYFIDELVDTIACMKDEAATALPLQTPLRL